MSKKCISCGAKLDDIALFCEECGAKQNNEKEKEQKEMEGLVKKEKEQKAKAELLRQENVKKEMESRTVRGTVYKSLEEAELAKKEQGIVDVLKSTLLETKSQKKRQEIFSGFSDTLTTVDALNRYKLLKSKVSKEIPLSEKLNFAYGITVAISFVTYLILSIVFTEENAITIFFVMWTGFGIWIWPIWKIAQVIKSKSKIHYKNLRDI